MNVCSLAWRWGIDPSLSLRLTRMAEAIAPLRIGIISGFRDSAKQAELASRPGSLAAADALSTHRTCPATGADLKLLGVGFPSRAHKVSFGAAATLAGLRWGGGSKLQDGIPEDWNHVDLGPRMDEVAEAYRRTL
jgi:hypothetical protein